MGQEKPGGLAELCTADCAPEESAGSPDDCAGRPLRDRAVSRAADFRGTALFFSRPGMLHLVQFAVNIGRRNKIAHCRFERLVTHPMLHRTNIEVLSQHAGRVLLPWFEPMPGSTRIA